MDKVGTTEEHAGLRAYYAAAYPIPTLLLALNEARDGYEIVLDPHDIGGQVDPMMLLNFRRKV